MSVWLPPNQNIGYKPRPIPELVKCPHCDSVPVPSLLDSSTSGCHLGALRWGPWQKTNSFAKKVDEETTFIDGTVIKKKLDVNDARKERTPSSLPRYGWTGEYSETEFLFTRDGDGYQKKPIMARTFDGREWECRVWSRYKHQCGCQICEDEIQRARMRKFEEETNSRFFSSSSGAGCCSIQ